MTFFWILWGFDAIISFVVLYFFFVGLGDGTVSSFNMGIWLILLAVVGIVMVGSLLLKPHYLWLAKALLCIMAIPGFIYTLFLLFIIIARPRWN